MIFGEMFRAMMRRMVQPGEPATDRIVFTPIQRSGVRVTDDNVLTLSALWCGVQAISSPIGALSWHVLQREGESKRRREDLPVDWILNHEANSELTAGCWRELALAQALLYGNHVSEIERSGSGQVLALWPIPPDRVLPRRDERGRLVYEVWPSTGPSVILPARDVFHLRGLAPYDGIWGQSLVKVAARSLGLAMATEENAASFFGNASTPSGVLSLPGHLSEDAKAETRKEWFKAHGGATRKHNIAILDQGVEFKPLGVPPEDAQLIETRKLSVTEIARWLRVPPHKLMDLDRATFSNIEEQSIAFVAESLLPWIRRLEAEANIKLFGVASQGRLFTKLNIKGLLRGKATEQAQFLTAMMDRGVYSVNEAREYLDLDGIGTEGDKRFVPLNMQLLEQAGEEPEPEPIEAEIIEDDNEPNESDEAAEETDDDEPQPINRLNGQEATP